MTQSQMTILYAEENLDAMSQAFRDTSTEGDDMTMKQANEAKSIANELQELGSRIREWHTSFGEED